MVLLHTIISLLVLSGDAHSFEDGQKQALESNKLMLVMFTADWCGPCQRMKQGTLADPEVRAAIDERFVLTFLDIDDSDTKKHSDRYLPEVKVPWLIAIHPSSGNKIDETVGYKNKEEFLGWLSKIPDFRLL